jgi:hypothetical protein
VQLAGACGTLLWRQLDYQNLPSRQGQQCIGRQGPYTSAEQLIAESAVVHNIVTDAGITPETLTNQAYSCFSYLLPFLLHT